MPMVSAKSSSGPSILRFRIVGLLSVGRLCVVEAVGGSSVCIGGAPLQTNARTGDKPPQEIPPWTSCRNVRIRGLFRWCERGDSNPHTFRYQILSLARLPIPPLSHQQLTVSS